MVINMNFKKALDIYLNHVRLTLAEGTYNCYSSHKTFPLEFFGDMKVKNINKKVIAKYVEEQRLRNPKIKNVTINKHLKLISKLTSLL